MALPEYGSLDGASKLIPRPAAEAELEFSSEGYRGKRGLKKPSSYLV